MFATLRKKAPVKLMKNVFYFTSKALFVLEIIKVQNFRHSQKKKCILLNKLGVKRSLLMKFGQFTSYYKRNRFIKNYTRTETWKLVPDPFCVWKEVSSIGKMKFLKKATCIRYLIAKRPKFIQIDIQASSGSFLKRII